MADNSRLASLPKPKETEWELELPEEQSINARTDSILEEDANERDRRNAAIRKADEEERTKRRTQVIQKGLPLIPTSNLKTLANAISSMKNPYQRAIAEEMANLIMNDHQPPHKPGMEDLSTDIIARVRAQIQAEIPPETTLQLSSSTNNLERASDVGCFH